MLLMICAMLNSGFGQAIYDREHATTVQDNLDYMNKILKGTCELEFKKKMLYCHFTRDGAIYREDKVYMETLDPDNVGYSPEEEVVIVRCRKDMRGQLKKFNGGCVERHFLLKDMRKPYYRINFKVGHDKQDIEGFELAMKRLIEMAAIEEDPY